MRIVVCCSLWVVSLWGAICAGRGWCAEESPAGMGPAADGRIASPEPDWPEWRGRRRDGICDEKGLLPSWPERGPPLLWRITGLGTGWSSPIVVGERLYVTGDSGDDLLVSAYDLHGVLQWRVKNGQAWTGSYPGARACCAFAANRLYHLNAHGRLACLDAATGRELWSVDVLRRFGSENITWGLSESVLVDGARVLVTPGGKKALMAAFHAEDGRLVWTSDPLDGDPTSYSSPILFRYAGRRILANCSATHGFGVDADSGRVLWSVPLKNQYSVNVSMPEYGAGSVFYVTPYGEEGRSYRLRAAAQGIVAEEAWKNSLDTVTGGAVLVDGTLFAAGYRKSKWWFAVDWRTGQSKCELKDLSTGAAIYADGRLYCFDERGTAGLVGAGSDRLELVGRIVLETGRARDAWTHPVLNSGRLYLRYHDTLWCYDVKQR